MREGEFARGKEADQVELEKISKILDREFINRFVGRVPAGIVDQTVDAPESGDR